MTSGQTWKSQLYHVIRTNTFGNDNLTLYLVKISKDYFTKELFDIFIYNGRPRFSNAAQKYPHPKFYDLLHVDQAWNLGLKWSSDETIDCTSWPGKGCEQFASLQRSVTSRTGIGAERMHTKSAKTIRPILKAFRARKQTYDKFPPTQ